MNKINHQILCILLDYRHPSSFFYTVPLIYYTNINYTKIHTIWNFALQKCCIEVQHVSFRKAWRREVEWNMIIVRNEGKDAGKDNFFPRAFLSTRSWRRTWNGGVNPRIFNLWMLEESDDLHISASFPTPAPQEKKTAATCQIEAGVVTPSLRTVWMADISLPLLGIQIWWTDYPARGLVAEIAELSVFVDTGVNLWRPGCWNLSSDDGDGRQ